jgi:hypothetical protein
MDETCLPILTKPEETLAEVLLNPPDERSWRRLTLGFVSDKWHKVVDEVERDYGGNVDDYCNDLTWRDRLGTILLSVPAITRRKIAQVLDPVDERFVLATRSDESDPLGQYYAHGPGWWWRRLPIRLPRLLVESLGHEAISSTGSHPGQPH